MRHFAVSLSVLALLVLSACDSGPVEPEVITFDQEAEFFLAEAGSNSDATPAERAGAAVAFAEELLAAARERIGASASTEVQGLLAAAEAHCTAAAGLLAEERWRAAVASARACAMGAREAVFQAAAERRATVEAQVTEAVAQAAALVAQAAALVGGDSPDAAKEALARAQTSLAEAEAALEGGRLREAMARARVAGSLAQRIIRVLG